MKGKVLRTHILLRRGNQQQWKDLNPILLPGQIGVSLDVHKCKVGDGVTPWKDLPYFLIGSDLDVNFFVSKTYEEWETEGQQISQKDKFYLYFPSGDIHIIKLKIGDGVTKIQNLPFVTDNVEEKLNTHIYDTNIHTSLLEKSNWNSKINIAGIVNNTLVFEK